MAPQGVCREFAKNGKCKFKNCKFQHIANGQKHSDTKAKASSPSNSLSNSEKEFRSWKHSIPLNSKDVLHGGKLASILQKAHQLIEVDVGVRQSVIQKLSEENGLACIKMVIEQNIEQLPASTKQHLFKSQFLPLLKTASHPDVLQSLILERAVGTIYNFLFGVGGGRASMLLTFCSEVLRHCTKDESTSEWLEASLVVFSRIVDLNSTALVQESLKTCASQFQEIFTTWVTDHPDNPLHESRVHLERLLRRFEIGVSLPAIVRNEPSKEPKTRGSFIIRREPPGGRHDNDHADICQIRIMPTFQEISSLRNEYLPPFDPTQWHVNCLHGLLDRNFRLLREDTVGLLRDAIHSEIQSSRNVSNHKNQQRTNVYQNGKIMELGFHWKDGFHFKLGFSQPTHVGKVTSAKREEWWKSSKRLQPGALVCLIMQRNFVVFCTVINPQAAPRKRRTNDTKSQYKESDGLWKDPQEAAVFLQLTSVNDRSIEMVLNHYTTKGSHIALVEFPGVLLPAFESTLKALQLMKRIDNLPFSELLIPNSSHAGSSVDPPLYTTEPGFQFNLRCLMNDNSDFFVRVSHPTDLQKLRQNSSLDDAQASALVDTLQRKIGLIQGPPGTGKSYTGVALIKVLLANKGRGKKRLGPIICVTYTNHALDQLLESLLHMGVTKQIVRMGGQSKSEILKPYNLHGLSRDVGKTKMEKGSLWAYHTSLERCEKDFEQIGFRDEISPTRVMHHLRDIYPAHYNQMFGIDEDGFQRAYNDNPSKAFDQWRRAGGKAATEQIRRVAQLESISVWQMSQPERESLFKHWQAQIRGEMHEELINICTTHKDTRRDFDNILSEVDLRCLSQADVIGVTTTGLARNLNMLRRLQSKVVLCEEAGEVLEPHLLTALLPSVEHAILIGDHYQLRPQVQNYELSRENRNGGERYSLDVSLFERLVERDSAMGCALPYSTLQTQRRMHPSIAELVRETLYPQLQDAPSVSEYPFVKGIRRRLFWLDHREPEGNPSNAEATATSRWNDYEVEMTTALVNHLVSQGEYGSDEIAILTPYLGQLQKLRRRLGASFAITLGDRDQDDLDKAGLQEDEEQAPTPTAVKGTLLQNLRVATIDNFQGEEASVVVISLVRSNPQNNCGFLRTSNRINVLLSRAKHGMYIIGNSMTSMHVPMWADVIDIFKRNENIVCGEICPLEKYCQTCGSEEIKNYPVDFIMGDLYKDIALDDNPCIFPKCGHFLTMENMDGLMDMGKYYVLDESGKPSRISASSEPFSISDIKTCASCRGPLRDIARYGRLVRRAILDESTKKLILYLNREYVPLAQELPQRIQRLQGIKNERPIYWPDAISMKGERNLLVGRMRAIISAGKNGRWKEILDLRQRIATYQKRVSPEEQPYARVRQLATNAHRQQITTEASPDFEIGSEVLQTKGFLQGTALSLQLDIALLADFFELRRNTPKPGETKVDMDLSAMKRECEALIRNASESKRLLHQAEGYIFLAQLHAFERSHTATPEIAEQHLIQGTEVINQVKALCNEHPAQTQGLATEIEGAEKMLRGATFYTTVTNEERMAVIAAMAREFSGTGHWYYCRNGHPFTIGECGMAMQRSVCPECGGPVGGQNHQAVEGVTHARDLDVSFAQMGLH
ncbi:hypothetical protein TCE0_033r08269 [Talaromyces pinophilus]|uniref:Uncharacterized protein n=1 Tax=Talaromyces pinophilus TaxID=128442 RepID=A0A6V8H9H9_TALPI|nr:hypothetical protein TCE0_033r08269 [Talaromyces pinophilus]